jgi:outer membrane lipoprotein-sorting protein
MYRELGRKNLNAGRNRKPVSAVSSGGTTELIERNSIMNRMTTFTCSLPAAALFLLAIAHPAAAQATKKAGMNPEVKALVEQCTAAYSKMKSYHQIAVFKVEGESPDGPVNRARRYILALERPAKFCFKSEGSNEVACVSDGKTFINFNGRQYTKQPGPSAYKGINIVDDVLFQPLATYVIALMLQGNALADKDVKAALENASIGSPVEEGGKKWTVLNLPFGQNGSDAKVYVDSATHLIGKLTQTAGGGAFKIVETYEKVLIDKPVDAALFQYTPPADAKLVEKLPPPLGGPQGE